MADNDIAQDDDGTTVDRRTAIKGAVAAGVGAAAWAGPSIDGIGLVPAYASNGTPGGITGSGQTTTIACSWPIGGFGGPLNFAVGDGSYQVATFGNVGENGGPTWNGNTTSLPTNCDTCQVTNISMTGCNGGCNNDFNAQDLCDWTFANNNGPTPNGFPGNSGRLSCECEPCTAASCGGSSEVTATFTVTCT